MSSDKTRCVLSEHVNKTITTVLALLKDWTTTTTASTATIFADAGDPSLAVVKHRRRVVDGRPLFPLTQLEKEVGIEELDLLQYIVAATKLAPRTFLLDFYEDADHNSDGQIWIGLGPRAARFY